MAWHHVADTADLATENVIGRTCAGLDLALYRLDDRLHATSGLCTHGRARLCEGEVVEGYIECPLHFGLFEIATGKAAGAPVCVDLRVYAVRLDGSRIEVELPD